MAVAKISCIYLKKQRFWNNGTWILVKYAIFGFKMSSQVKSDPADLMAQKNVAGAKIWGLQLKKQRFGDTMQLPEGLEDSPFKY